MKRFLEFIERNFNQNSQRVFEKVSVDILFTKNLVWIIKKTLWKIFFLLENFVKKILWNFAKKV